MKIVIVEGDASIREQIRRVLGRLSIDLEITGEAEDGRSGYELILQTHPDLIIMDTKLKRLNGLSMLRQLRDMHVASKVIILSESELFNQAKKAIELGADGYLIKPFRKSELCRSVMHIWDRQWEQRNMDKAFGKESIFLSCLNGQLHPDHEFHQMTLRKYGFTVKEPAAVCTIRLEEDYENQKPFVCKILEQRRDFIEGAAWHVMYADVWNIVIVILYQTVCPEKYYEIFQKVIIPSVCASIRGDVVCLWKEIGQILELPDAMKQMQKMRAWNLFFDRGYLIRCDDIQKMEILPLRYPPELETRGKHAVLSGNAKELRNCYYNLYEVFRNKQCGPEEMKENLIRFNLVMLAAYKTRNAIASELDVQDCMHQIMSAMTWSQIRSAMEQFFQIISPGVFDVAVDSDLSPLVHSALHIVRKYYDQGITLEETADRLFVSKEYLSTQFKKETGIGFTETVRKYRVERIKELLLGTRLKLRQIAELTGYSDSKYMSRVFREETGMLPTEFRKMSY